MTPTFTLLKEKLSGFYDGTSKISVQAMTQEFSSRQYYRICQNDSLHSMVLQVTEPFISDEENTFVVAQKIYQNFELPVPSIHRTCPELGWVLLDDLGDLFLQKEPSKELYFQSIDYLVDLASRVKMEKLNDQKLLRAPHWKWAFDYEKLQQEMAFTEEHFFQFFLKYNNSNFVEICSENSQFLSDRPRFFCHRDYHSRNLMIHHGRLFIIDFQDSRMGPISYDVASLVWDPYSALTANQKTEYFEYWINSLERSEDQGIQDLFKNKDGLLQEVERMKIQRMLKAIGSYAGLLSRKGRGDYLPYIVPAYHSTMESLNLIKKNSWVNESDLRLEALLIEIWPLVERNLKAHA